MHFITVDFDKSIERSVFDCEVHSALNTYIAQHAGQDEKRNVSRTFMYVEDGVLLGYYSLANASVALEELSEEQKKRMPRYPMPAVLLSRLAVDKGMQGVGLGQRLMSDFFRRVYTVSKQSGVAFVVVDAKDQEAADYYQRKLGFVPSTNNPLRLVLSTATLIQAFKDKE
ncbi:GNAT family N-acetyltransferase [Pseudomonas sp.]|uniref:GNAT family N-acetyltransferase n=1 Tax=Pseudomonas sp. TaxID=306 RepID=UPI002732F92D|nr:GNAT family N-acetyltransferase [Pseudomonas sp.]MDP2746949.1 GNAT family N-acetyltransferase [Pseudomonas sp.]